MSGLDTGGLEELPNEFAALGAVVIEGPRGTGAVELGRAQVCGESVDWSWRWRQGGAGQLVGDPSGPSGGVPGVARTPWPSTSAGAWWAHQGGRWVRSINPATPSRAYRVNQVCRV